ncbi:bifunctional diaminohydroxyphosphoribosylaminopyrimidine deaminase/5-amino-6-(5-phosphoribosylamino)uracil reductase RibD [Aridibaculum aurantiacum]|uniref:bifunctional diaminohydroxyphosphoribosylaminopyrimidine deaminase/5-amino-6-(5-phosphoribosylamino)uracil reductase RibD n=1 Tax=Aridibaculum aurantiacum TaxID=2810307 RepID=UPI001A96AA80|nr:bifunctional diaminohydroxyphosphoribosylaminopyrimidine deaminase/5-amino-6-(5-phosphoribosylamino)uracil reductase RibD [Aridibaculum aurantiacum]
MNPHQLYMHRCLQLAALGEGFVAPNPMVGSVLVHNGRIIGEGYHQQYGKAHAEVNCINAVAVADKHLIPLSTLYVSLEPCAHYGKTPPCADLVITSGIRKVVVGCRDPFYAVDGKGIEILQQAGVEVVMNVLEEECIALNKRFFTFHQQKRPYITLKWAQTANGVIGNPAERLLISNAYSNRFVHQLRSSNMAILAGTNTALQDDPQLNVRHAPGASPVRLIIDLHNKLPQHLHLFDGSQRTVIFTYSAPAGVANVEYYVLQKEKPVPAQIVEACVALQLQSILIEGGAKTLQFFIDAQLWDEAIVIRNTLLYAEGIAAPALHSASLFATKQLDTDLISYYKQKER